MYVGCCLGQASAEPFANIRAAREYAAYRQELQRRKGQVFTSPYGITEVTRPPVNVEPEIPALPPPPPIHSMKEASAYQAQVAKVLARRQQVYKALLTPRNIEQEVSTAPLIRLGPQTTPLLPATTSTSVGPIAPLPSAAEQAAAEPTLYQATLPSAPVYSTFFPTAEEAGYAENVNPELGQEELVSAVKQAVNPRETLRAIQTPTGSPSDSLKVVGVFVGAWLLALYVLNT